MLGYNQIPGMDFTDKFAPMVNDITFHPMLSRKLIEKLSTRIIDVEMAFLYGELEDKIYMETPGEYAKCDYKIEEDKVLILNKAIYGLGQAAYQYWKKFIRAMEKFRFKLSKADLCFMYKKTEKGICMMSIYVDDNFLVGHKEALDEAIDQIKSTFNIKIQTEENDYLGYKFLFSKANEKDWLGQPHVIKSLPKKFGH